MTCLIKKALRRFRDSEEGSMVVPFALWTPIFVGLVLSTIELGTVTLRHTALERALDQTTREVKLGTGRVFTHAGLKADICERAAVLPACQDNLQLEMVRLDLFNWSEPEQSADCVDTAIDVTPQRAFEFGQEHELMLLRACYKYRPISPTGYMSASLPQDAEGYTALVATNTFVGEPM